MDWRILGYEKDEPFLIPSNSKREKFIEASRDRLFTFLKEEFTPLFKKDLEQLLNQELNIYIDKEDSRVVNFAYPSSFSDDSILDSIRLEIGALAAWTPTQLTGISPYAFEYYPQIFEKGETEILTTTAERTFWEKATILHQEAQRPETSVIPMRYSRHYYGLYCMKNKGILEKALKEGELLEKVAEFKRLFYPRGWAHYEKARIGTLMLFPAEHSIDTLKRDYEKIHGTLSSNVTMFAD